MDVMTDYIEKLLNYYIVDKSHHKYRDQKKDLYFLAEIFAQEGLSDIERSSKRLEYMLKQENPVVFPNEKIAFLRTVQTVPEIYTKDEWSIIKQEHYIHEQGKVCNICPDYASLINAGFNQKKIQINKHLAIFQKTGNSQGIYFLENVLHVIRSIENLVERYRIAAVEVGNNDLAKIFARIPQNPPRTFWEALQFFRVLHFCLWSSYNYHNTIGRFDNYMWPYLKHDIESGLLNKEQALELIEEFFISFNKDSDLYPGMQQGDNGQSLVLGGTDADGNDTYNELSDLCLQASLELKLIDPKINLRVNRFTTHARYVRGTQLTKQGLGFPQYSNDDVVLKALRQWGYEEKDAINYVVAACWEFIIPGRAMDIPNIAALSFADALLAALPGLKTADSFDAFLELVHDKIVIQVEKITQSLKNVYMEPALLLSLMMDGCIESGRDISLGCRYNNYGVHGTGLSTAVDSLAAIEKFVYKEKILTKDRLLSAIESNFDSEDTLLNQLRYDGPKMGNDENEVDRFASYLLDWFADALEVKVNDRGGIFRPGTGSAMYYIWHSKDICATPDGRQQGEPLACNYSPSLFCHCRGPVSIIKSFSKPNLHRVANGGPLTIELHESIFRNQNSLDKVAQFVQSFMNMGGHQMQINTINRDDLIEAKKHPENYRNLIVRVWGWSGYFVELDEEYQDHIIKRMELRV